MDEREILEELDFSVIVISDSGALARSERHCQDYKDRQRLANSVKVHFEHEQTMDNEMGVCWG